MPVLLCRCQSEIAVGSREIVSTLNVRRPGNIFFGGILPAIEGSGKHGHLASLWPGFEPQWRTNPV